MIPSSFLLLVSLVGLALTVFLPGWADYQWLAALCAIASAVLFLIAGLRRIRRKRVWLLLDGSNVMHWKDGTPQIQTVREVLRHLSARGYTLGVVFDANAGYLISGRYQHDAAFGRMLGLPTDCILVVGKGTIADTSILAAARQFGARVVTNDRYRDWAEAFPEVREPGFLIRGGYTAGELWVEV